MKKVEIASTITITVVPNLNVVNLTDRNSVNPNKLRAKIEWEHQPIQILEGKNLYPLYVTEWDTTKNLVELGHFTIGKTVDEKDNVEEATSLDAINKKLSNQEKEIARLKKDNANAKILKNASDKIAKEEVKEELTLGE